MTRPLCPACTGTRVMGDKHPRPCTCCEDGTMRGIDDPTPEELKIESLKVRLANAEAAGFAAGRLRAAEDAARGCEDFAQGIRDTFGKFPLDKANAGRIDAAHTLAKLIRASKCDANHASDPTPEERRIAVLSEAMRWIAEARPAQMTREQMQNTAAEALRRAEKAGGR